MSVMSALFKLLYRPVCRTYARHVMGDSPADRAMCFLSSIEFGYVFTDIGRIFGILGVSRRRSVTACYLTGLEDGRRSPINVACAIT